MPGSSSNRSGRARLLTFGTACLLVVQGAGVPHPAHAEAVHHPCGNPPEAVATGAGVPLRCRLSDSSIAPLPVRSVTHSPAVAEDLFGGCWYGWWGDPIGREIVSVGPRRSAIRADHAEGGSRAPDLRASRIRLCFGESAASVRERLVWEVLRRHRFALPAPLLAPVRGLAGLEAYLNLAVPGEVCYELDDPDAAGPLTLEIAVSHVVVDWGDGGESLRYRAGSRASSGYPDGMVRHRYESVGTYVVGVGFEWRVRWQVDGGPWHPVDVRPTAERVRYRVDEIVSRILR